ncbi:MAG: glutamine--fructose-6-phosphate aminotransferase, partial [Brevibacterium sp.]|nr:glutamine--fructose-6-phosphate aminotransferase [Brevibacterium sp.]
MCGIVGYVSKADVDNADHSALDVVLSGLKRLEYRGYDSAGVALVTPAGDLETAKKAGKLSALTDELAANPLPNAQTGIGHTRWATHGGPTDLNAHPHVADGGKLALIHNGIIENFAQLKRDLTADGVEFQSETDTEVAAAQLAKNFQSTGDLTQAMRVTATQLEGAFTLLAVHADAPGQVVAARRNSPLVIGLGEGENFLGSDVAAFIDYTRTAVEIGQDQVVTITPDSVVITDNDGNEVDGVEYQVDWDAAAAEKGGFPSFMDKEIHDQPQAVADTLLGRLDIDGKLTLDEMHIDETVLKTIDKI